MTRFRCGWIVVAAWRKFSAAGLLAIGLSVSIQGLPAAGVRSEGSTLEQSETTGSGALEFTLPYSVSPDPHQLIAAMPGRELPLIEKAPEGLRLPKTTGATALFARWESPLAPGGFLWVCVASSSDESNYDLLFIDANGSGRLDDDEPVTAVPFRGRTNFGPIELELRNDDGWTSCNLNFLFQEGRDRPRLIAQAGGWHEGPMEIGGVEKNCVLLDANADGTFDDSGIDFKDCDLIQIADPGKPDIALVGKYVSVDDEFYKLEVGRTGGRVRLAPAHNVAWGVVRQPKDMVELVAGGPNGMITLKLENGTGRLPEGRYRIYQWIVERTDAQNNVWRATSHSFGNPDIVEVVAGETVELDLGEPFLSSLAIREYDERMYRISHGWKGRAGENITLTVNGASPPPAQVHIRNASGTYDRIFTFEHG